jgi:Cu(I)/Ag(I) efflux system membrane fusion protein
VLKADHAEEDGVMEEDVEKTVKTGYSRRKIVILCVVALAVVLISIGIGYRLGRSGGESETYAEHELGAEETSAAEVWTCSMHPQIRQPKPGQCPLCGMDLIPVMDSDDEEAEGITELKLSPRARKLAEIQTTPVERKLVTAEVRMAGKVEYDETRVSYITAWVGGRLDRLFVDYTGVVVEKGDHMVRIYSPELLAAQEELIQAIKTVRELEASGITVVKRTAQEMVEASREKLRLWGLTPGQISEIETRSTPSDHTTISAPVSGVVVHKNAQEGEYVKTGTRIYTIADLSHVWVKLDAYESDLALIRLGQEVDFHTEAYPSESFKGTVAFIDPVLNPRTRTAKVRINLENRNGRLKPEMFVHAVLQAEVGPVGRQGVPRVIPASAPLLTGKRAVVYVETEPGLYEGREVVLGPRAGEYYVVIEGLEEGERVVTRGNFKIDSAIQILAKPSMMNPEGGGPAPGHQHGEPAAGAATPTEAFRVPAEFKTQIDHVFAAYLKIHHALSRDVLDGAQGAARTFRDALDAVDMRLLKEPAHSAWMKELQVLSKGADALNTAGNIADARTTFRPFSESMYTIAKQFGTSGKQPVHHFFCSMAFDGTGGYWLQSTTGVENPYYGAAMFRCGEMKETIVAGPADETRGEHEHD